MSKRNAFRRLMLNLHNWMGLIIGIQIVFWFVGGLVMTVLPLDLVRGERSMSEMESVSVDMREIVRLDGMLELGDVRSVTARQVADVTVLQVTDFEGRASIYDAETGDLLSPIPASLAEKAALSDFTYRVPEVRGDIRALSTEWITEEPGDFRRRLPVWRVNMNDPDGTRIYVSPETGRVLARRNDYWRVFDFFWMLHIMDYDEREDFNHPLLIIVTLASTLFVLTGVVLLYYRFWPRRRKQVADGG